MENWKTGNILHLDSGYKIHIVFKGISCYDMRHIGIFTYACPVLFECNKNMFFLPDKDISQ